VFKNPYTVSKVTNEQLFTAFTRHNFCEYKKSEKGGLSPEIAFNSNWINYLHVVALTFQSDKREDLLSSLNAADP
jgi:hypothetical protein